MEVGAVVPEAFDALARRRVELPAPAVSVARRELAHLTRPAKQAHGSALSEADIDRFPEVIANPQAVLYEPEDRGLLFVFEPATPPIAGRASGSCESMPACKNNAPQMHSGDDPTAPTPSGARATSGWKTCAMRTTFY